MTAKPGLGDCHDRMMYRYTESHECRWRDYQVAFAAESLAASLFARCGCDVSVQFGANQQEYDLIVAMGPRMLKASVKGRQDGSWGLTQSHLKKTDFHAAIDTRLGRHKERTNLRAVQGKPAGSMA